MTNAAEWQSELLGGMTISKHRVPDLYTVIRTLLNIPFKLIVPILDLEEKQTALSTGKMTRKYIIITVKHEPSRADNDTKQSNGFL